MSENSAFWEGHTTGDAASLTGWAANYTSNDMSDLLAHIFDNYSSDGFVIPEYEDELLVHSNTPDDLSVLVEAGSAFVLGRIYDLTNTEELAISANIAGNPRIDRVILRITFATQTIRLAILEGAAAAIPSLPSLTQDAAIHEISLAYLWVAAGTSAIAEDDIHDERLFLHTCETLSKSFGGSTEIVNSEFLAPYLDFNDYAMKWAIDGGVTVTLLPHPDEMPRGNYAFVNVSSGSDPAVIYQTFPIKAATHYSIKALLQGIAGYVGYIQVTTNAFSPFTVTRTIRRTGVWMDELIYYTTEDDATEMTISVYTTSTLGDRICCGQILAVEGYYPGHYREVHEFIVNPVYTDYHSEDFSTETVTWDITADLPVTLDPAIVSVLLNIGTGDEVDDSSEIGAYVTTYGGSDYWFSSVNKNRSVPTSGDFSQGEIGIISSRFDVDYVASGVDTLNTRIKVVGVVT